MPRGKHGRGQFFPTQLTLDRVLITSNPAVWVLHLVYPEAKCQDVKHFNTADEIGPILLFLFSITISLPMVFLYEHFKTVFTK